MVLQSTPWFADTYTIRFDINILSRLSLRCYKLYIIRLL